MKRFILFLVRKRLGLKKNQKFRFTNQKTDAIYYFTDKQVVKEYCGWTFSSGVSLNWLLDDRCKIELVDS